MSSGIITLTTDFGACDGYVGAMKGVMLGILPKATIVDISHEIPPQDIDAAAFVINSTFRFFPPKSVHVVVVDPAVGSARRILCVAAGDHLFLAPDNGVLKFIFQDHPSATTYHVSNSKYFLLNVSRTFHGRDIFAPVAAHLANGLPIGEIGNLTSGYEKGRLPNLVERGNQIIGEVIYVDRFGNLVTNISAAKLEHERNKISIRVDGREMHGVVNSYFAGQKGEPIALIGSAGLLEIAVNSGSAKHKLTLNIGDKVTALLKDTGCN
jgi:hypothetical protein